MVEIADGSAVCNINDLTGNFLKIIVTRRRKSEGTLILKVGNPSPPYWYTGFRVKMCCFQEIQIFNNIFGPRNIIQNCQKRQIVTTCNILIQYHIVIIFYNRIRGPPPSLKSPLPSAISRWPAG